MINRNSATRVVASFALCLLSLSGCGGGGNQGGVDPVTSVPVAVSTEVPPVPANVTALGGTNKITLSWTAVSGASSYNVYWTKAPLTPGAGTTPVSVSGNSYLHRGLLPAAGYYYAVTAQNSSGESVASGQVSAFTSPLDGSAPYNAFCAGCHGPLTLSSVSNMSVPEVRTALQGVSVMSALTLTEAELGAICAALMYNN
jgi:mono/diheme cytochrome c family protein